EVVADRATELGVIAGERAVFHVQRARVAAGAAGAAARDVHARVPDERALAHMEAAPVEDPSPKLRLAVRDGQTREVGGRVLLDLHHTDGVIAADRDARVRPDDVD